MNGAYSDKSTASRLEDPRRVSSPPPTAVSQAPVALSHFVGTSCLANKQRSTCIAGVDAGIWAQQASIDIVEVIWAVSRGSSVAFATMESFWTPL